MSKEVYNVRVVFMLDGKMHTFSDLFVGESNTAATDAGWRHVQKVWPSAEYNSAEAKIAYECNLTTFQRVKLHQLQMSLRHQSIADEIQRRGYYMVQLSPRKYAVIHAGCTSGISSISEGKYIYYANAVIKFTGKYGECKEWLFENTPEILREHKPR